MDSFLRAISLALLGVFILSLFMLVQCTAEEKPLTIRENELDEELGRLWKSVVPATGPKGPRSKTPEWQMKLTTWLPSEWPPRGGTVWTRYAYGLDVSMDGASDVSAPFARVERRRGAGGKLTIIPMATKLKVIAVHPVRPHGGWRYTLEDEKRMLTMALALTGAPPSDSRGGIGIKSYFQSWRLGNAEIAAHVQGRHRAFFNWLGH